MCQTHVRKLQVLQSKCFRIATTASWYVVNRQIQEDLGVPFYADHIRFLTERFDSKLVDVENPALVQLGKYLRWPSVDPGLLKRPKGDRKQHFCRGYLTKSGHVDILRRAQLALFDNPDWGTSRVFCLSCKANARV
jgi:hypothetical protein